MRTPLLVTAAFAGGAAFASWSRAAPAPDPYGALAKLAQVLGYVERSYVEPVPFEAMIEAAIEGVVGLLDGPSQYLSPEAFAALEAEASLVFGGVGVVLSEREGAPTVVEVLDDSAAWRAGVAAGAVITSVDGVPTADRPLARVAGALEGSSGTTVEVGLRPPEGPPRTVRLVRGPVVRSTVAGRRIGPYAYLRIARFDRRTELDVRRELGAQRARGALRGTVLDLRGNPGGLVDQAVRVADLWLSGGPVVTTVGRERAPRTANARPGRWAPESPVAVLMDGETASAAEILAAALQEREGARLFGARSFGKGSVQSLIELGDGSALELTVARYTTPSGRALDGVGLEPDEAVDASSDAVVLGVPASDPALAAALRWLGRRSGRARP